eukprot:2999987-Rhodomonas_salina.2
MAYHGTRPEGCPALTHAILICVFGVSVPQRSRDEDQRSLAAICLRTCYAMSGTDLAYGAMLAGLVTGHRTN